MEQNPDARMPCLVEGVDMRQLPLGPEEAFVMTRVDGRSSEADIAAATGLDAERVRASLTRLVELGAVRYDVEFSGSSPPPRQRPTLPPGTRLSRPVIETAAPSHDADHPAAALYDPAELDEEVDIDLPRKRQVLDYFYRLDMLSHYELLGVAGNADRKTIKEAYFKIVGTFHPDKYYGKKLGNFKPKLERVFQRLTEAQDILARSQSRADYDAYLASQNRAKNIERQLEEEAAELEAARKLIEEEARMSERASQAPPAGSWPPSFDPEERRKALARKLRGSVLPPGRGVPPSEAPPSNRAAIQEHVAEELKRRYEARLSQARDNQVRKYVEAAEVALSNRDVVSAANALRIAVSLKPDDEQLKTRFDQVQERASTMLADTYLEQARYEESNKHFLEAAATYEKVSRGRPSANIFDKIAVCLLEGGGDMRKAGEMARKAVQLAPKSIEPRITLGQVYLKAGMRESALGEFERLAQANPNDANIKDWIKRIKRGDV